MFTDDSVESRTDIIQTRVNDSCVAATVRMYDSVLPKVVPVNYQLVPWNICYDGCYINRIVYAVIHFCWFESKSVENRSSSGCGGGNSNNCECGIVLHMGVMRVRYVWKMEAYIYHLLAYSRKNIAYLIGPLDKLCRTSRVRCT